MPLFQSLPAAEGEEVLFVLLSVLSQRLLVTFSARVAGGTRDVVGFLGLSPQKQEDPLNLWPPWFLSFKCHHVQTLAIHPACR